MLQEISQVKQIHGEPHRRWFSDDDLDLIVWLDERGEIIGFQLCYNKGDDQHALTWQREKGFSHNRVDDGEAKPGKPKSTPILVCDGYMPKDDVAERFASAARDIDDAIAEMVLEKINHYPDPSYNRSRAPRI